MGFTEEEINEQNAISAKIKAELEKDAEIRAKYKYIRKVKNTDDAGTERVAYFREPNRLIVGIAMAKIEENVTLACEYIFDDAVIKEVSDWEYFRENNSVFYGIIPVLQRLAEVKKSTVTT